MKKLSLISIILMSFYCVNSYAGEIYARGYIIAIDTRADSACKTIQQKIKALSSANVSNVCTRDAKNPYSVIVATLPIAEFEFSTEEEALQDPSQIDSTDSNDQERGMIYFIPKQKEFDHYLRFTSHYNKAAITFSRQPDFPGISEGGSTFMIIPFVIKSSSEYLEAENQNISSSVHNQIVLNGGAYEKSQSRYFDIIKKQTQILGIVTNILESAAVSSISFEFFATDTSLCRNDPLACGRGKFGLGLGIKFSF